MHLTASTVGEVSAASSDQLPQSSHRALGDSISGLLITDPIPATTTDTRDLDSSMVSEEDRGLLSGHATDTERSMALSTQTVEAAAGSPIMSTLDSRDGELGQARPSCSDSPEPRAAAMSLAAITSIVPEEAGTPSTAHTEMTEDTPMPAEIPTIEETARTEASALISVHPTGDRDNNGSMLEPGEVEGESPIFVLFALSLPFGAFLAVWDMPPLYQNIATVHSAST